MKHILVAITGASGAAYGVRLTDELLRAGCRVSLLLSEPGRQVLNYETGLDWSASAAEQQDQVRTHLPVRGSPPSTTVISSLRSPAGRVLRTPW